MASGRLEAKIATTRAALTPPPDAMPIPRTACSGMPSRKAPTASGAPADDPPDRPPHRSHQLVGREEGETAEGEPAATAYELPT